MEPGVRANREESGCANIRGKVHIIYIYDIIQQLMVVKSAE